MTDPADLAAWIRQQLDEDERIALATTAVPVTGEWRAVRDKRAGDTDPLSLIQGQDELEPDYERYSYGVPVIALAADWLDEAEANLRHIAHHDPARVLRAVAAKRALLDLHTPGEMEHVDGDVCMACDVRGNGPYYPCQTLRLLAAEYADRPGYREEWKP